MKIVFVSNFINHHQVFLADELYALTNNNYYFIETERMPDSFKQSGYPDFSSRPYIIKAWKSAKDKKYAKDICKKADVMIFGGPGTLEYALVRKKNVGITFEIGERCLKKGWINIFSPHLLRSIMLYYIHFKKNNFFALCNSAYAAKDWNLLGAYKNKCFKWGYFTKTSDIDLEKILEAKRNASRLKILWVARFLILKHPELPVKLAKELKQRNIDFEINMYGSGPELENIKKLIFELNVSDKVNLCGTRPNDEILSIMRGHDVFLFTSDRNEGWGAVVNEAMSNACCVIASDAIGSVPFLIQDGINGMIFKNQNLQSLLEKTLNVIDTCKRESMSINAYKTLHDTWSPRCAAKRLISLCEGLLKGAGIPFESGPCSIA